MRYFLLSVFLCVSAISQVQTFNVEKEVEATVRNLIRYIEEGNVAPKDIVSLTISKKIKNVVKVNFVYGANSRSPEVSCDFRYSLSKGKVVSNSLACQAFKN